MKARADKHNLHESHVSLQGAPFIHCLINCKPAIENIRNFSFSPLLSVIRVVFNSHSSHLSRSVLGRLCHTVSFIIGRERCWISKFPVRLCLLYRSRQTNATVTLSWFMHSCVPPCWIDDIWHRFHMLKLFPFDACTNTGAETTDSKCFDAISQQSVKQKTFVAFYTARENSVNSKGRRDQSTEAESLCWCHSTPCVWDRLREDLTLIQNG